MIVHRTMSMENINIQKEQSMYNGTTNNLLKLTTNNKLSSQVYVKLKKLNDLLAYENKLLLEEIISDHEF